jgi:hypothetical protein
MMNFRVRTALILAAVMLLSTSQSHGSPLVSCSNVGFSPGNDYTITGRTYRITSADSIADVNALSLSPGDAVLFEAGNIWNIGSEANRLKPKTGVLYGRYGTGANPVISGAGVSFGINFRGTIDIVNVNNVTVDGIDVKEAPTDHFGIYVTNADNITVRRLTVSELRGGGVVFGRGSTNILVEYVEIFNVQGGPHESLTFTGTNGYVARYNYSHNNGHAGINNKGFAKNGELYGNEIHSIYDDPSLYVERAENLVIHDNWVHDNDPDGTGKVMLGVNIENYGSDSLQYNRNIEIYNNVVVNGQGFGARMWIKPDVAVSISRRQHDVHWHHNTFVNMSMRGTQPSFMVRDGRSPYDTSDWTANVVENNIIWDTNGAHGADFQTSTLPVFTVRNNLYQTGTSGGADLGSNAVFTNSEPFVDLAGNDFTPAGAALRAGSDGSDIGAKIDWSCGTSTPNSPVPPLPPILE